MSKKAYFRGPTRIVRKDGTLIAEKGVYNTITGESTFEDKAVVDNESYTLSGKRLAVGGPVSAAHQVLETRRLGGRHQARRGSAQLRQANTVEAGVSARRAGELPLHGH